MRTLTRSLRTLSIVFIALGAMLASAGSLAAQRPAKGEKIVVSGASGQLGGLVIQELLARGVQPRDLILVSRTPETLASYRALGAETRYGDFYKPESLPAAFAGGRKLLLISIGFAGTPRPVAHKHAIDAAAAAGVQRIVYTSYIAISQGDTSGLASDHYQTEELIKKSGMAWTLLRNSIYSNGLVQQGAKLLTDGKATLLATFPRIGYVTREDCAAAAAAALLERGRANHTYDITGPELVGLREIAAAASEVTGKSIEWVPADPNTPARPGFGGPSTEVVSKDVARLTGRPATSVRALFAAHRDELLGNRWLDAWAVSFLPTLRNGALDPVPTFDKQTFRLVVFGKLAGNRARVKLTNRFQSTPLQVGAARLALRDGSSGGAIIPATDRALTFGGQAAVTLAPGEERWSDPVDLAVPRHADLAISLFLPAAGYTPTAVHGTGSKTSYLSAPGDHTRAATMPAQSGRDTTASVFFVSGVQVMAPAQTRVIVTFGDSITDGAASAVDANGSWPDVLSQRLPALRDGTAVSVINMGIGSNRLVASDKAGPAGVKRFDEDVLARPNVSHVIVLEGINDISYEHASADQLIAAYRDLIARSHARGIKVYGGTLLPIQKSVKDTPENEATRQAVNEWIRRPGSFDAVIDFEKVVQDPANPLSIRADLTSDHVHPNTDGYRLMAEAIDLALFEPGT